MDSKKVARLIKLNRKLSWILVILSIIMLSTGYMITRIGLRSIALITEIHTWVEWLFIASFVFHFVVSVGLLRFRWMDILEKIRWGKTSSLLLLRFTQRVSGWAIFLFASITIISGLSWYRYGLWRIIPFTPHVISDIFLSFSLVIHVATGLKFYLLRKRGRRTAMLDEGSFSPARREAVITLGVAFIALITASLMDLFPKSIKKDGQVNTDPGDQPDLLGDQEIHETLPKLKGIVRIGEKRFEFEPRDIKTIRPDLFNPGYFSIFDILVHIGERGLIDLRYHFNESMNTHVINSIDGETDIWYQIYYDGGWPERSVFRPDHYPWKDGTMLSFDKINPLILEGIYSNYKMEMERKAGNNGKTIIPQVQIRGRTFSVSFEDVEVKAHNLRNDVFREDVITAIDVIMSLEEQGKIKYDLKWYESIGTADIVKSYWVESIEDDTRQGRCGFVYEAGPNNFSGFRGNHIHLPCDTRIIHSPEYALWFWICV